MDDTQLEQTRSLLSDMRGRLVAAVESLKTDVQQSTMAPGRLSNQPTHPADFDSEGLDKYATLADTEDQLLEQVDHALHRLRQGTYGICERCQRPISRDRLDALPYTPYCMPCASGLEQEEANRQSW